MIRHSSRRRSYFREVKGAAVFQSLEVAFAMIKSAVILLTVAIVGCFGKFVTNIVAL